MIPLRLIRDPFLLYGEKTRFNPELIEVPLEARGGLSMRRESHATASYLTGSLMIEWLHGLLRAYRRRSR